MDPQKVKYRNLADRNTLDGGCDGSYVWDSVVSLYSRLDLTRKADKLPALSGIAKREQKRRHGDQYIAGLWRSTLVYDLMWRPSYSSTTWYTRSTAWRCPSWSWASTDTHISPSWQPIGEKYVTILDVSVTLAGSDPTGELLDAYILLSGLVVVAEFTGALPPDRGESLEGELHCNGHRERFVMDCERDIYEDKGGNRAIRARDSLTCLRLARGNLNSDYVFYLVLRLEAEGTAQCPPTYKRVGCIEAASERGTSTKWHPSGTKPTVLKLV